MACSMLVLFLFNVLQLLTKHTGCRHTHYRFLAYSTLLYADELLAMVSKLIQAYQRDRTEP